MRNVQDFFMQTKVKTLKAIEPPNVLNVEQITLWIRCHLPVSFKTYCVLQSLRLIVDQAKLNGTKAHSIKQLKST